jgi:hypothetical protein
VSGSSISSSASKQSKDSLDFARGAYESLVAPLSLKYWRNIEKTSVDDLESGLYDSKRISNIRLSLLIESDDKVVEKTVEADQQENSLDDLRERINKIVHNSDDMKLEDV